MTRLSLRSATWILSAGLLCAGPLLAQTDAPPDSSTQTDMPPTPPQGGHRHGGPEHRLEMLQHELGLSAEQTTQVKAIFEGEHARMEALRANTSLSQDDRRSQMMAMHQDTDTKIRALLTADQTTKFDTMQARMREHHRDGQEGPPPPPPSGPSGN